MALKVSSWIKTTNDELLPVCQPNDILTIQEEKYKKLTFYDDLCLEPCWKYFKIGYECFIWEPQFDSTVESYIYNLFNFTFSFRQLKNLGEEKTFTLKKNKTSWMCAYEMDYLTDKIFYVSDIRGFALLKITDLQILIYYYDFERKFTSDIKITFPRGFMTFLERDVKLINRSIWIVREVSRDAEWGNDDYLIDLITIKDEKEWYFVRSLSDYPIRIGKVLSKVMFVGNNYYCNNGENTFCSCKVLFIDREKLKPYRMNWKPFVEFDKPKELRNENVVVLWIYKTILILRDRMDSNVLHFLNYNKNLQLEDYKRLDLSMYINAEIAPYGNFENNIIPEINKMFLFTLENSVAVIDMRTFQVTQILECTLDKVTRIIWSEYEKMINFICDGPDGHCLTKYVVSCGNTLKELALNVVADNFSTEKIQAANLPHSLVQEILNRNKY